MQNDGLVKKVVGKTFEEIVMDDSKDVFLEVLSLPSFHAARGQKLIRLLHMVLEQSYFDTVVLIYVAFQIGTG